MGRSAPSLKGKSVIVVSAGTMNWTRFRSELHARGVFIVGPLCRLSEVITAIDHIDVDAAILDVHLQPEVAVAIGIELMDQCIPFVFVVDEEHAVRASCYSEIDPLLYDILELKFFVPGAGQG